MGGSHSRLALCGGGGSALDMWDDALQGGTTKGAFVLFTTAMDGKWRA